MTVAPDRGGRTRTTGPRPTLTPFRTKRFRVGEERKAAAAGPVGDGSGQLGMLGAGVGIVIAVVSRQQSGSGLENEEARGDKNRDHEGADCDRAAQEVGEQDRYGQGPRDDGDGDEPDLQPGQGMRNGRGDPWRVEGVTAGGALGDQLRRQGILVDDAAP
jgi:hypothetical protein